jgi:hypothetical protein
VFSDSGQALGGLNTQAVALSDVDNDGDLDLVAGNGFGGTREVDTVWLNGGDSTGSNTGVFIDTGESLGSSDSRSIALGDVDGDGDLDLVTANSLFLNPLASTDLFIESIQLSDINRKTFSVSLGDVDGDGDLDLVAGNGATGIMGVTSPNRIWFNGGDSTGSNTGVFNNSGQVLGDSDTTSVALGDLDGDSDLDLVAGNGGTFGEFEPNRVWLNSGLNTGIFIDSGQSLGNVPGFPLLGDPTTSVVLGDIDGDADLDLIAGNGGDFVSPNRVWRNDGDANFSEDPVPQELGRNSTTSIALGDLDGDGDLDLVAGNGGTLGGSEPNRVWLNSGLNTGIFIDSTQSLGSDITTSIALGDIDGDGDLDLVAGNNRQSNRVWRNDGNAYFSEDSPPQLLGTNATTSVSLVDVDDDGDLDLIEGIGTRSFGDAPASNRLWLNGGDSSGSNTGVFIDSGLDLGNDTTTSIAVGDIDGDDDPDYIEASVDSGDFKSTVWLNDF